MVSNNEAYYNPRVQAILTNIYGEFDNCLPDFDPKLDVTTAQFEVLKLMCKQFSSKDISMELGISVNTGHRHRQDLMERIGSQNLACLVIYVQPNKGKGI